MILLDTTVLVYAVGSDHPLRLPCRHVVELVQAGALSGTTTIEVIQEFVHVRSRRTSRSESAAVGRAFAVGLGPLVRPEARDLLEGLALWADTPALGAFDTVLAATARRRHFALVSADRGFGGIDGLVHVDPAAPDFAARLQAITGAQ